MQHACRINLAEGHYGTPLLDRVHLECLTVYLLIFAWGAVWTMGYCITCMCIVQPVCLSVGLRALVLDLAIMLGAIYYLYAIYFSKPL